MEVLKIIVSVTKFSKIWGWVVKIIHREKGL